MGELQRHSQTLGTRYLLAECQLWSCHHHRCQQHIEVGVQVGSLPFLPWRLLGQKKKLQLPKLVGQKKKLHLPNFPFPPFVLAKEFLELLIQDRHGANAPCHSVHCWGYHHNRNVSFDFWLSSRCYSRKCLWTSPGCG